MPNEEHHRRLERMYATAPINQVYKPTLAISEGRAQVSLEIGAALHHAAGTVHGSVYFKALDDAAFFAVASTVEDVFVLTVSFEMHLLRAVSEGEVVALGELVHASRRLLVAEARLRDDEGRLLARGSGTFVRSRVSLSSEVGYR